MGNEYSNKNGKNNCIFALFSTDPENVLKLCDFVLINRLIANAFSISRNTVLMENVEGTRIVCQNSTNASWIKTCTSCIIKPEKGCFVKRNELRTLPSIPQNTIITEEFLSPELGITPNTQLQIQESQSGVSHSLNLAIIQSFFAKKYWEKFKADLTVKERPPIELPEFKSF